MKKVILTALLLVATTALAQQNKGGSQIGSSNFQDVNKVFEARRIEIARKKREAFFKGYENVILNSLSEKLKVRELSIATVTFDKETSFEALSEHNIKSRALVVTKEGLICSFVIHNDATTSVGTCL